MKRIELIFKNVLLKILIFFNPVKKENTVPSFNSKSTILFIRLNRIGDALVTTPLLHEIKKQICCKIIILADRKNHFIFSNNPSINEVIVFKKGLRGITGINNIISEKKIDVIVDLHDDVSTTVSFLIAIAKVKYKFGLLRSNHTIYTHTVEKLNPVTNHVVDRILEIGKLFNIKQKKDEISVKYFPSDQDILDADSVLGTLNPRNNFLVGINISAGSSARFWGVENYRMIFDLLSHYDITTILFCTESDYHLAKQITKEGNIYPPTKVFGNFAAAIMKLSFLITPDTSIVHIASIKKISIFGIYVKYNTNDMIWSPYNTEFECVITKESTLKNIKFEEVKNKLIPFLEKKLNAETNSGL